MLHKLQVDRVKQVDDLPGWLAELAVWRSPTDHAASSLSDVSLFCLSLLRPAPHSSRSITTGFHSSSSRLGDVTDRVTWRGSGGSWYSDVARCAATRWRRVAIAAATAAWIQCVSGVERGTYRSARRCFTALHRVMLSGGDRSARLSRYHCVHSHGHSLPPPGRAARRLLGPPIPRRAPLHGRLRCRDRARRSLAATWPTAAANSSRRVSITVCAAPVGI